MYHHINQHQLTRLCLTGKGIVCGLDICMDEDFGIHIRAGNGITSNGDYIEVAASKCYRFCKLYTNENYSLFAGLSLWELTDDPCEEPLKPQNSEEELNAFLRDKVVLIYKDKTPVNPARQSNPIHFILIKQQDVLDKLKLSQLATQILWQQQGDDEDFIYNDNYNSDDTRPRIHTLNLAINPALRLPELFLQRFGFGSGDPFNCPPEGVDPSFFPSIKSLNDLYNAYLPIIDKASIELDKALNRLCKGFPALLGCNKKEQFQEWIDLLCEKWEAFKRENEEELEIGTKYYIQYFYDWVRDLIQAYNELRQEISDFVVACCGSTNDFPCHLFLGIAFRDDLARQPTPLRHSFQQPPIYNGNADRLERLRLYWWRILMMIKGFYLSGYIQEESLNPYCEPNIQDEEDVPDFSSIKITPSKCYDLPLGEQSIPFYYPVTWSRFSVHHFWNYERTKTCSTDQIFSYHASDFDDSYTLLKHVIRPLHYSLNNYPFFRVEGHIGKHLNDVYHPDPDGSQQVLVTSGVLSQLKYLKQKYNLPFYLKIIDVADLTEQYEFPSLIGDTTVLYPEQFYSLQYDLLGSEHIAGVKPGGTIVLVVEKMDTDELDSNGEPIADDVVIGDFYLPCCYDDSGVVASPINAHESAAAAMLRPQSEPKKQEKVAPIKTISSKRVKKSPKSKSLSTPLDSLLAKVGKIKKDQRDSLQLIKGIGDKYEKDLNELGIYNLTQISKMTEKEYDIIDILIGGVKGKGKREDWASQASDLLEKKGE